MSAARAGSVPAAAPAGGATAAPRPLGVCADDFGYAPGISRVISTLAGRERLQAVSCLVTHADWKASAPLARDWPASVDVGLHFNLSEGTPLSAALRARWPRFPSLPVLLARAHLRLLPLRAIADELDAQLDAFVAARGARPAFIDGHQHVHALPGVRRLVLDAAQALGPGTALRNTGRVAGPGHAGKRRVIARAGGVALQREMRHRRVPHNPALVGVYGFDDPDYGALVRGWLACVPPEGALLFCHPGSADAPGDPIAAARAREAAYLASAEFERDLQAADVVLAQVW